MRKIIALALLATILAPACSGREENDEQELKRIISATSKLQLSFVYQANDDNVDTVVTGKIQDDLRNQLLWKEEGQEILERIVSDDSLAVRVITPARFETLAAGPVSGSSIIGDALRQGAWVVDPSGAPPLVSRAQDPRRTVVGVDPLQDSINMFKYMTRAIDEARAVVEFNEDDIEYRPDLDPFEKPNLRLGVRRFDLRRLPLPGRSARSQQLPTVGAFRKMSWYVKDDRVIKVVEKIDIRGHEEFIEARKTKDKRKSYLLEMERSVLAGSGQTPVRERDMAVTITPLKNEQAVVSLPPGALNASLRGLFGGTPTSSEPQPGDPPADGSTADPGGTTPPGDPASAGGGESPSPGSV